jgi:hypothetical protein
VPTEKAEKYIVRVTMKADPFAIDEKYESVITSANLQGR